jgi:NAD(P)-dependent dehydrogenase (short-subunit alcohol dehydrogenase family)
VTRLDGAFGFAGADGDPTAGGLAGLAKTAGHEWPEVACKAIDVAPGLAAADAAAAAVEEFLTAGPAEVGIASAGRTTVQLAQQPVGPGTLPVALDRGDVVVVSGGARGVTAAAALDLARAYRPTLVLLGRSPLPEAEPDWLSGLTEEADIKRAIGAHLNGDASPRKIGEQYQQLAAQREVRQTLARIEAAGSRVVYHALDVTDAPAVARTLDRVRAELGPIAGVVHGAGVLADRRIEDQTDEQFERVCRTKVAGLRSLLAATAGDALKFLALFSSSTGRFGRTGQVAYAVANEVLNKAAQQQARLRPACRVVALNWGPWEGGMVTPALAKVFAAEGVGLIPLEAGGNFLVSELSAADRPAEVVVLAGSEFGVRGSESGQSQLRTPNAELRTLSLAFEREIDLARHPVLWSHVIDARAVLPMALHLEWLAHAALHGHPGLAFAGFDGLHVLNGVFVEEDRTVRVQFFTGKPSKEDGGGLRVPVEMHGERRDGRDVVHSRAEIVLAPKLPAPEAPAADPELGPYEQSVEEAYARALFHGRDLRGIERVEGWSEGGIVATVRTAPAPSGWMRQPLRGAWLADPLVLDCAFQAMVLWTTAARGAGSLPTGAGRYRQFRRNFPAGEVRVAARVTHAAGQTAHADIDFVAGDGSLIARMSNYECVIDPLLAGAFRRNRLGQAVLS